MPKLYMLTESARKVGVSIGTLKRWERQKEYKAKRDSYNRRIYTDNDIDRLKVIKAKHESLLRSGSYFKGAK